MKENVISAARGDLVRRLRVQAGLTQPALADAAGLSVRALRDIEQGKVARPHPASLRRLAQALQVNPDELTEVPTVEIGVLGPLSVSLLGQPVPLTSPAQQALLGLLALEADRSVSPGEIADVLWGEQPPPGWRNRVHAHINGLRQLLEPSRQPRASGDVITSTASGYQLRTAPQALDSARFLGLLSQAGQAARSDAAALLYQQALACWRGPILDGGDGTLTGRPAAQALLRARLSATVRLADLSAELGRHDQALFWLEAIAVEEPLHEGVHARLMTALAGTGRQDRALQLYRELRARLAAELGVDPAPATQAIHRAILAQGEAATGPTRQDGSVPAQLPMAMPSFAGRDEVLNQLIGHLTAPPRAGELPSPRIVVVHGMPGVGKTSLALQVSHRLRSRYPDGQLYADLRGDHDQPAPAATVAAGFLRALGVAASQIPADLDERSAMLRSHLAGRRVLIMLDDARSAGQVLPLLPADQGNHVLVTSRGALAELPVTRLRLEPLSMEASLSVLAEFVSADQLAVHPVAAGEIAGYCAGLPLALHIAAARLHTGATLPDLARLLADTRLRVGELHSGQLAVRASLESSLRALSGPALTALRRLAALPTRTVPRWAVQVALHVPAEQARPVLAELSRSHLLSATSQTLRHYTLHDLVRLHAVADAGPDDLDAAEAVLVQWFHLADAAGRRLSARLMRSTHLGIAAPDGDLAEVAVDPHTWFDGEYRNIIDSITQCAADGRTRLAAGLLNAVTPYLRTRGLYDEWQHCTDVTAAAATSAGDLLSLAHAAESAVRRHIERAALSRALPLAEQGLALFEQVGEPYGACQMLYHLQYLQRRDGDTAGAVGTAGRLVQAAEALGDLPMQAAGHQALGLIHREYLKDLDSAAHHLERALAITAGDPTGREHSQVSTSLATVYIRQERHDEAERLLVRALNVMRAGGDRTGVIYTLTRLSYVWPPQAAAEALAEALAMAEQEQRPEMRALVHQACSVVAERDGDLSAALRHMRQAAELHRALDSLPSLNDANREIERLRTKL